MPTYLATITGNAIAESKNNHTPSVHLQLKCEQDLEAKKGTDKVLYADLWLTDKAKEKTVETLRAIGYEGGFAELNTPSLVGYQVEVSTYFEDYNGNSYEKVNFVNPVGSFAKRGVKPADAGIVRGLSAKYDSLFRSKKATGKAVINTAATAAPTQQNAPQQGNAPTAPGFDSQGGAYDDLPF